MIITVYLILLQTNDIKRGTLHNTSNAKSKFYYYTLYYIKYVKCK